MTSTKQCYYLGANANGISILLIETEILPSDPDVTKGVRLIHGGLGLVARMDVMVRVFKIRSPNYDIN